MFSKKLKDFDPRKAVYNLAYNLGNSLQRFCGALVGAAPMRPEGFQFNAQLLFGKLLCPFQSDLLFLERSLELASLVRGFPNPVPMIPEFDEATVVQVLDPDEYVFYVDGKETWRTNAGGVCQVPLYIKLSDEIGSWAGDISEARLKEDAEIFFVLTTNRPQALEAALASRPGRIDQAIEFPLPDSDGRRKLVALYAPKEMLHEDLIGEVVRRTDGVSAAFIKELMRRSAQFAVERGGNDGITHQDVDLALDEMLFKGGSLNRKLLGAADESAETQAAASTIHPQRPAVRHANA